MTPVVVFDGNCQSHHLAAILDATGLAVTYVNGRDYGLIPSFRGCLCRYADESKCLSVIEGARQAGRIAIQASQATPMASLLTASYSACVDRVVRFPYLQFSPMLHAATASASGRTPNYARAYEVDLQMVRACQAEAGSAIDFAQHIETHHPARPLFHMHVHPGPELMGMLVQAVCAQVPEIDQIAASDVATEVAAGEAINMFTQHPLPAELMTALGLEWPYWYEPYGQMIVAARTGDHDTLVARRSEFQDLFGRGSQFWGAYFNMALSRGDREAAAAAFQRLSALSTGYIGIWYAMYVHGGRNPDVLARATAVYAGQRQLDQFLSRVASEEGQHDEAIALAQRYLEAARDLTDGVVPLVLALQSAGWAEEARQAGAAFALASEDHRRDEVVAALARLPKPVILADYRGVG